MINTTYIPLNTNEVYVTSTNCINAIKDTCSNALLENKVLYVLLALILLYNLYPFIIEKIKKGLKK